jgi:hypothetical protein
MKDILINYPIKILQQELINIRTSYRLEKKIIIEILKDMKSIKKLTKEELIELLIKYNYDISKLPKLEDLIKPKKERKPKAKKEPKPKEKEINNIFKDIPKLDDVFKDIDKKDKYKAPYSNKIYKYTDKDKKELKEIIKKMYEIINKYDVIKKDLLFIKDDIIKLAELENETIGEKYINYNDFIDKYLLSILNKTLLNLEIDKYDIFTGTNSFNDIIRNIIDSYYISREVIYREFDNVVLNNLINDKFNIEDAKKKINRYINIIIENKAKRQKPIKDKAANTISNAFKIKQAKQELEKSKLEKEKNNYLDNKEDIQSINFYEALIKDKDTEKNIKKNLEQLIIFYNKVIKIKKDILNTTNYEDFNKLKDQLEKIYIDIDKLEKLNIKIMEEKNKKIETKKPEPKEKVNKRIKELKTSTYIPSNYLFNNEYYFDDDIWDKKYTMTDLINNWDTDIIPIIFYNIEPKLYNIFEDMVKRVNGLISKRGLQKNTSLIIPELLVFTKDINNKIVEHYIKEAGTRKYKYKYAIDKLYMGMYRIIERIYLELQIPRTNITNVFGDNQETIYLRGVKQGLPVRTLQNASKEMLFFDDKKGTFIRNPETLL